MPQAANINIVELYLHASTQVSLIFTFVFSINLQIWKFARYFLGNKYDPLVKKQAGDSRSQPASGELEMPTPSGEDRTVQAIIQQVEQGCRAASLCSSVLFSCSHRTNISIFQGQLLVLEAERLKMMA